MNSYCNTAMDCFSKYIPYLSLTSLWSYYDQIEANRATNKNFLFATWSKIVVPALYFNKVLSVSNYFFAVTAKLVCLSNYSFNINVTKMTTSLHIVIKFYLKVNATKVWNLDTFINLAHWSSKRCFLPSVLCLTSSFIVCSYTLILLHAWSGIYQSFFSKTVCRCLFWFLKLPLSAVCWNSYYTMLLSRFLDKFKSLKINYLYSFNFNFQFIYFHFI